MSYAGSIIILDDEGNSVFERELSSDEIIEVLLKGPSETVPLNEVVEEPKPKKRKYTKREAKQFQPFVKGLPKPCCGSKGPRHMKDCSSSHNRATSSKNRHTVDDRKSFSEPTWYSVKNALDSGDTIDSIVRDKGLSVTEIRRVNLSDNYQEYLTIA
jgi:hypothetical protein